MSKITILVYIGSYGISLNISIGSTQEVGGIDSR
jgi:hypothetical protein